MSEDVFVKILKFAKEQGDTFRLGMIKDKFPEQSALIDFEVQHEHLSQLMSVDLIVKVYSL